MTLDKEAASPFETWAPTLRAREKPWRLGTVTTGELIQSQKARSI